MQELGEKMKHLQENIKQGACFRRYDSNMMECKICMLRDFCREATQNAEYKFQSLPTDEKGKKVVVEPAAKTPPPKEEIERATSSVKEAVLKAMSPPKKAMQKPKLFTEEFIEAMNKEFTLRNKKKGQVGTLWVFDRDGINCIVVIGNAGATEIAVNGKTVKELRLIEHDQIDSIVSSLVECVEREKAEIRDEDK